MDRKEMEYTLEELKVQADYATKWVNDYTKKFENLTSTLKVYKRTINDLIKNQICQNEYIEALNFIMCFNWSDIENNKLRKEVYNKNYTSIYYPQTKPININELPIEEDVKIYTTSSPTALSNLSVNSASVTTVDDVIVDRLDKVLGKYFNKLNSTSEEVKQDLDVPAVGDVVYNPTNYSKEIVYNVYRYLKDCLELDKTLSKYLSLKD